MMAFQFVQCRRAVAAQCCLSSPLFEPQIAAINMQGDDGQMRGSQFSRIHAADIDGRSDAASLKELSKMGPLTILRFIRWYWGETQ